MVCDKPDLQRPRRFRPDKRKYLRPAPCRQYKRERGLGVAGQAELGLAAGERVALGRAVAALPRTLSKDRMG